MKNPETYWTVIRPFGADGLAPSVKTLLFCGNGYLGVQAFLPGRDRPAGTFINGFYETSPITYGEKAFGYPSLQQVMVPLADVLSWTVEEQSDLGWNLLSPSEGTVELNLQTGIRTLRCRFQSASGMLEAEEEVMTPFRHPHRLCSRLTLAGQGRFRITRAPASPGPAAEESADPRKMESLGRDIFRESRFGFDGDLCLIEETAAHSGLSYACAAGPAGPDDQCRTAGDGRGLTVIREITAEPDKPVRWEFGAAFFSSLESADPAASARREQKKASGETWDLWEKEQKEYLDDFWRKGDILLENTPELTCALRFGTYGLIQSTGKDSLRSAAAKGLSSSGYNGHYFWDADIYVQCALSSLDHERARNLTAYRISRLDEAKRRAEELSEKGALYPWRTIDGRECSAFFPAGTAQFHINADIIWGMKEYIDNSGDKDLLLQGGAEMLMETARFWAHFAVRVPGKGYCLHCVTGPDEYTALVNNNFYTNLMAREHLNYACQVLEELETNHPDAAAGLKKRISLEPEEPVRWRETAREFYLPLDPETGIFMQDDAFFEKSPWDWASTPRENRPLLLHYHPLKIYRHKVLKQPDVVMGLILQRQLYPEETIGLNYDYYDPLTSGDSSLSSAVQAVAAALAGKMNEAEEHFRKNLFLDLEDREGNTDNGVHLAAMAGSRMAVLLGFAGYRVTETGPELSPRFPESWGRVSFSVVYKDAVIQMACAPGGLSLTLNSSGSLSVRVYGRTVRLESGRELTVTRDGR